MDWAFDGGKASGGCLAASSVGSGFTALVQSRQTDLLEGLEVSVALFLGDQGAVAVVVGKVNVRLLLDFGVEQPVVDTEGNEVDLLSLYGTGFDALVLLLDVGSELGAVVTSVGLFNQSAD